MLSAKTNSTYCILILELYVTVLYSNRYKCIIKYRRLLKYFSDKSPQFVSESFFCMQSVIIECNNFNTIIHYSELCSVLNDEVHPTLTTE